jgi:thiol-disulfide isomerase/thioredoxin
MDPLTIDSPAPELLGVRWLQGDPVTTFEPGHLYVVEFWSTWCGPCRATIPKLSEIAAKFAGKVTVVGVDIFEENQGSEGAIQKVEEFVAKMGSKMTYRVLIDGDDRFMADQWMKRSGRQGIPSAFVVDGSGKIAWMGHPASGLEKALSEMIEGTYVPQTEPEPTDADTRRAGTMKALQPFMAAVQASDFDAAMIAVDDLAKRAEFGPKAGLLRFQAAAMCGRNDLVRQKLAEFTEEADDKDLWVVASIVGNSPGLDRDIYLTAIGVTERFLERLNDEEKRSGHMFYEYLGNLYFYIGATNRAIDLTKMAIDAWRLRDAAISEQVITMLEAKLEQYEEAGRASS